MKNTVEITVHDRKTIKTLLFTTIILLIISYITVLHAEIEKTNHKITSNLPDFTNIIAQADPSVVNIRTMATIRDDSLNLGNHDPYELFRWFFGPDIHPPGFPQQRQQPNQSEEKSVPKGLGSGFFISDDGYILTNNHVVDEATDILVTLTDGREFKAKIVGTDERTDVALLKIETNGMIPLVIGDLKSLRKGQWVLAIGSPFGLDSTVTSGIISAIGRDTGEYLPFIQTDVAVNPGNSGGPLLNLNGEVIGVNSQIISRSGGFMGISLAIPIDEAMRVASQLKLNGKVTRGRIGIQISEVNKEIAKNLGLTRNEGALVNRVERDSPAERAGIQGGDVILKFNEEFIKRWSDLPRIVGQTSPGLVSNLEIWRRGKTLTISIMVDEINTEKPIYNNNKQDNLKKSELNNNIFGLSLIDIPVEMQSKMRIKGGVQVRNVDGISAKSGIRPGDIILAINNIDISNSQEFEEIISKLDKEKSVILLVQRGDHTQWIPIYLSK